MLFVTLYEDLFLYVFSWIVSSKDFITDVFIKKPWFVNRQETGKLLQLVVLLPEQSSHLVKGNDAPLA